VTGIEDASSAAPLVSSVLALARSMGVRVVAEGVERPGQATWLRHQGFLWSGAVPVEDFLARLVVAARPEEVLAG
jgi:EAL domain-containing protein (putative c-di-GMP-specific phosphodiesterase class I)